ncbi:MAG: hypothetical protein ABI434_19045, partial [Burkholderiaceae bacterium]
MRASSAPIGGLEAVIDMSLVSATIAAHRTMKNTTNSAPPPTLFRYVLRAGGRHQIGLLLLSVVVFLLSTVPLEIQRRIVNDAIRDGAVKSIVWLALAYFGVALFEGGVKLGLNIYRAWVSEKAVLDLRR